MRNQHDYLRDRSLKHVLRHFRRHCYDMCNNKCILKENYFYRENLQLYILNKHFFRPNFSLIKIFAKILFLLAGF